MQDTAVVDDAASTPPSDDRAGVRPEHLGWRSILLGGIVLFVVMTIVMFQTDNANLYATVVLVGSFLIPVAFVAYLYDHLHLTTLSFEAVTWAFVIGGVLGILGASVLEPLLLPQFLGESDTLTFRAGLVVALIEEGSKLAAVMFVARRLVRGRARDGLLLGTAVGMGFAAFESTGYAFTVLFATGGDIVASLEETVVRALIAPFGHGIWTGIVAAALFASSRGRQWHFGPLVWLAFAFVVLLHAAWDGLHVGGVIPLFGLSLSTSLVTVSVVGLLAFVLTYGAAARAARRGAAADPGV
jgi:protease PrsW